MKLLTERIGQGPQRQCDARCYNATHGKCDCICGGRNHGAGEQQALQNVREMFAPVVLCEHGHVIGACPEGCYKPALRPTPESDKMKGTQIEVTGRAMRAMRRLEVSQ